LNSSFHRRLREHGPEIPLLFDSPAWETHLDVLAGLPSEGWLDAEEKAFLRAVWAHYGRAADEESTRDTPVWKEAWKERLERQWPEILSVLLTSASPTEALREYFARRQADGSDLIKVGDIRTWGRTLAVPGPIAAHAEWLKARDQEARGRIDALNFDADAFTAWARRQAKGCA
jgi:hypothetical protein